MDTSETYIKMCDWYYIQDNHEPAAGDYYIGGSGELVILPMEKHITGFCTYECLYLLGGETEVWLPRQDQIQEMIGGHWAQLIEKLLEFTHTLYLQKHPSYTWEQLWLAFYMKEKHNKIWDGEKWLDSTGYYSP